MIVPVKSLVVALGFASVNLNATPNSWPTFSVAGNHEREGVNGALAIVALEVAIAWLFVFVVCVTVTVTAYGVAFSSAYVWLPATVKLPFEPAIVPLLALVPSPQLIEAENSPAGTLRSASLKVATVPENGAPSAPENETAAAESVVTVVCAEAVSLLPPTSWSVSVTV